MKKYKYSINEQNMSSSWKLPVISKYTTCRSDYITCIFTFVLKSSTWSHTLQTKDIYISIIASDCSHAHLTNFVMYISLCTFYWEYCVHGLKDTFKQAWIELNNFVWNVSWSQHNQVAGHAKHAKHRNLGLTWLIFLHHANMRAFLFQNQLKKT